MLAIAAAAGTESGAVDVADQEGLVAAFAKEVCWPFDCQWVAGGGLVSYVRCSPVTAFAQVSMSCVGYWVGELRVDGCSQSRRWRRLNLCLAASSWDSRFGT